MFSKPILLVLLLAAASFSISVLAPQAVEVQNGDTLNLGTIGPGQTVSIVIDRKVTTGGIHGIGGLYDQAQVYDLPKGWGASDSKLYEDPLQVTISAAPDATEGQYSAKVKIIDENNGEGLGEIVLNIKLNVTYDVMNFDVSPPDIKVGPGQPARFAITITNKGSTSDVFQVSSTGAKRWEFTKPVFVPAQSSKTIYYEIVPLEEATYKASINVVSLASKKIADQKNVTLTVHSTLLGDYKAMNNGAIIFPIYETITYAFAGFISNFYQ